MDVKMYLVYNILDINFCIRLQALQERDDEKVANEKAKNSLESYIFETREWLEQDEVISMSTAEQRDTIQTALSEEYNWFEEEGYSAETKVHVYIYVHVCTCIQRYTYMYMYIYIHDVCVSP